MASLAQALPDEVRTALAVEVVSRCTSARTPPQRSAPFSFVRLGPDVPLPLLIGTPAQEQATALGDRILFRDGDGVHTLDSAASWLRSRDAATRGNLAGARAAVLKYPAVPRFR